MAENEVDNLSNDSTDEHWTQADLKDTALRLRHQLNRRWGYVLFVSADGFTVDYGNKYHSAFTFDRLPKMGDVEIQLVTGQIVGGTKPKGWLNPLLNPHSLEAMWAKYDADGRRTASSDAYQQILRDRKAELTAKPTDPMQDAYSTYAAWESWLSTGKNANNEFYFYPAFEKMDYAERAMLYAIMCDVAVKGYLWEPDNEPGPHDSVFDFPLQWHKAHEDRLGTIYYQTRRGMAYAVATQPKYVNDAQWDRYADYLTRCVNHCRTDVDPGGVEAFDVMTSLLEATENNDADKLAAAQQRAKALIDRYPSPPKR